MAGGHYIEHQEYAKLKKNCQRHGHLFVDTVFPPTNASLFLQEDRISDIVWKRPAEIAEDPHLFVEGASANDVTQGILGNCWFVSACSALIHNQNLLAKVIPDADGQEWKPSHKYCGIFRFCFWRFGTWMEVVIDDLLPTRAGKLIFARSKTKNEFWSALLEKAFAKLYGCYENLVGGRLSDALQDVSGGVAETINYAKYASEDPNGAVLRLYHHLKKNFDHGALIVAAIAAKSKDEIEESLTCGLVKGHAYAVTAIQAVELNTATNGQIISSGKRNQEELLIRLQNPWGEKEWNGPWSDGSAEWDKVLDSQKQDLGLAVDEDGEFWMPWSSFVQYFTDISVCQLLQTSRFSCLNRFREYIIFGEWTTNGAKSGAPNDYAGGCLNFRASCCSNPQYMFDVTSENNEIMFSLTQQEISQGMKKREPYISIGMHIMQVERNRRYRLHQPTEAVATSYYANSRSTFLSVRNLSPGRYVCMPTTFAPREQAKFMLRIYATLDIGLTALTKHAPRKGIFSCDLVPSVTRVHIMDGELTTQKERDVYCILISGLEKCVTSVAVHTTRPEWKEHFIFHRSSYEQTYILQLWERRRTSRDRCLGRGSLSAVVDNDCKLLDIAIIENNTSTTSRILNIPNVVARISVAICAYDDPLYI